MRDNSTKIKSNSEGSKKAVVFFLSTIIICLLVATWAFIWDHFFSRNIENYFLAKGTGLVYAMYAVILFLFTQIYGGFKIGYYKKGNLFYSAVLSILFANALTYAQTGLIARGLVKVWPFILMTLIDFVIIFLWVNFAHYVYYQLYPPFRMLMVYHRKPLTESLVYKMSARAEKYRICETFKIEDNLEEAMGKILEYESVILSDVPAATRNELIKFCFQKNIITYTTPKISDILIRSGEDITLFDTPLLLVKSAGLSVFEDKIKRLMDITMSSVGLIITSPFMLITALIIKLYDRGPILYKQDRLTLNGKVFQVYKFRSMVVNAEKKSGARLASENDNRITPVGKLIRKTRLDELPQLINIFKGDMSVVGPRPERPEIAEEYEKHMKEFSYRLKVKAGLTGYAQVIGKYNTTPYDKLKMDLMYISKHSLILDIKLILMTIKILFLSESTEGIGENATTAQVIIEDLEEDAGYEQICLEDFEDMENIKKEDK